MEKELIDFTTFDGFKKYCEIRKVPLEIINNPAFLQFYRDNSGKIDMVGESIVTETTDSVKNFKSNDDQIAISAGSDGITISCQEPQRDYDNGSYDKKNTFTKIELDRGEFVITEDFTYSWASADYQTQISAYQSQTVSIYDNFGVQTVMDYYSRNLSYDRNTPAPRFNTDFADVHSKYERKYFDVAAYSSFDQSLKVQNRYMVQLSGENGYGKMVTSGSSNNISNFLDENIVSTLTPEDIDTILEREANPVVREGLKTKFVNDRDKYSYIPSQDQYLVVDGQNLQEILANKMVQQMENNTVDTMGSPINQNNDMSNKNTHTMGFGGMLLIGLITGIISFGIILFGILYK